MKKLLAIVVLGLLLFEDSFAKHLCGDSKFKDVSEFVICPDKKQFYNAHTCKCENSGLLNKLDNFEPIDLSNKEKENKFNSKKNNQLLTIFISLFLIICLLIIFKEKILSKVPKLKKLDKGLFRLWSVLASLWFVGSLFLLNNARIFSFNYERQINFNTLYVNEHSPFDALAYVLVFSVVPPLLLIIIWLILKWIYRGFK